MQYQRQYNNDLVIGTKIQLIVNDISNSSTGNIQHAIYYSGLYNKWYKKTYIFNSGVVTNITSEEVLGESIVLSNITFTHNGYNPHNIDRPDILLNDHTIIWLYGSSSTATETTTMTLDTQFPISWSLSGSFINAGVLSHSNTGNLVITYKKSQVLNGGTSDCFNLGNCNGFSVLEVISAVEKITGKSVIKNISPRRAGDPALLVGDAKKARSILNWKSPSRI